MQQEQKDLLQALYEENQGLLRLVAARDGVPECEVDDIVQETFYSFMRAYGTMALEWNEAQKKGVLMRILKNRCIDYFRTSKKSGLSIDSDDPKVEYEILRCQVRKDICDTLIQREELRRIHQCILEMKPKMCDVAMLCLVEGRPVEEVCEILDISGPTCRMRISRIRKLLREELKKIN